MERRGEDRRGEEERGEERKGGEEEERRGEERGGGKERRRDRQCFIISSPFPAKQEVRSLPGDKVISEQDVTRHHPTVATAMKPVSSSRTSQLSLS